MSKRRDKQEQAVRERAYFIWQREGCPEDQADHHWRRAVAESRAKPRQDDPMQDEEKILAGRPDVNYPALLTRDVPGG